jgi:hypothetical protein
MAGRFPCVGRLFRWEAVTLYAVVECRVLQPVGVRLAPPSQIFRLCRSPLGDYSSRGALLHVSQTRLEESRTIGPEVGT